MSKYPIFTKTWFHLLTIFIVILFSYAVILRNGFVWDDSDFLKWNLIKTFNPVQYFSGALPEGHEGVYRPLRSFLYYFSFQLYGINPLYYKIQAILMHFACSVIVYLIARKLSGNKFIGLITGVVFAVHPVQTEAVTFTTASFDLLTALFYFLSVYLYTLSFEYKKYRVLSYFAFVIALLSGELALTIPIIFILIDWYLIKKKNFKDRLMHNIVPIIILASYLVLRFLILNISGRNDMLGIPFYIMWLFMLEGLWHYFEVIIVPLNLTTQYDLGINSFSTISSQTDLIFKMINIRVVAVVAMLVTFFVTAFIYKRKIKNIKFGFFWFLIVLIPVLNILPFSIPIAERYLYIASYGIFYLVGILVFYLYEKFNKSNQSMYANMVIVITIFFIALFIIRTNNRNMDWNNSVSLWLATTSKSPNSSSAWNNLAIAYSGVGDKTRAQDALQKSLSLSATNKKAIYNKALSDFEDKKYEDSIEGFRKLINLEPNNFDFYNYIAKNYIKLNRPNEAFDTTKKALLIKENAESYNIQGLIYLSDNQIDSAEKSFRKALSIDKSNLNALNNLSVIYLSKDQKSKAEELLQKYLSDNSSDPNSYLFVSQIYENLGDKTMSEKMLKMAESMDGKKNIEK